MRASPSTARAINDRLALGLLQRHGPLTAAQLKTETGLSRPTVADLVERLGAAGLIEVVGESGAVRRGPNAKLYGIVVSSGPISRRSTCASAASAWSSRICWGPPSPRTRCPSAATPAPGPPWSGPPPCWRAPPGPAPVPLHSVGIGAPGLIDPATGELRDSTGLPAWHRGLVRELQRRLPATVLVENETNLAAVAELREGAAKGRDTFVLLWLGQGIGAAVMLDGKLRQGGLGRCGGDRLPPCPRGGRAALGGRLRGRFPLAGLSSAALCELASAHGLLDLATVSEGGEEAAAVATVRAALEAGEPGEPFLKEVADRLALGSAAVVSVLDPGCVLLAGAVGHAGGPALAARVEERLAAMSPLRTEVRAGSLGDGAVLRGALITARDAAQDALFAPED